MIVNDDSLFEEYCEHLVHSAMKFTEKFLNHNGENIVPTKFGDKKYADILKTDS